MAAMTPKTWTKGSIKSHIGWSTKHLFVIRGALLEGATNEVRDIGAPVRDLARWLEVEMGWLREMEPVPEHLTRSPRASFLKSYGDTVGSLAYKLNDAIAAKNDDGVDPDAWRPVGVAVLALLAHGENVYRI